MNIYHAFVSLKPGTSDTAFADALATYLDALKADGKLAGWRLMRRKLGLGSADLGEFHIMMEVENLAQLDDAFSLVASRAGTVEAQHHGVNSMVASASFALYRDFPDPVRKRGEEKF
ncbi:MAG: hypothetical protein C0606_14905 [Hyphomicrobiales bacterium]|nr:MAG: hypothetical protein C0606_14905 [Hyphomicrobiales bacterium]